MRHILLLPGLALLSACAGPLPSADPQQAWVAVQGAPGDSLLAARQDGLAVNDGRYYQLTPGAHELQLRLQFELPSGGAGGLREPQTRSCLFSIRYAEFAAGQVYRIKGGQQGYRPWVRLYGPQQQVLARGRQLRCGGF
jgi:hypothetical protein